MAFFLANGLCITISARPTADKQEKFQTDG